MNDFVASDERRGVWVEAISVHVPYHALSHSALAAATGVDEGKYHHGLACRRMALCHPSQDAVTMAAEAGAALIERWRIDPGDVGLLVVATESGVDWAKPIAAYLHQLLGISPRCRVFDVQHACYGGSAALTGAAAWVASGAARGRKALVVTTDIARYEVGSPGEPTQGAGAVAMLVGEADRGALLPDFGAGAVYASNVMDFWRPPFSATAFVKGKYSVECYLTALRETYRCHREGGGPSFTDMGYLLFHLPFPRMGLKALAALADVETRLGGRAPGEEELADLYDRKVKPGIFGAAEVGNTYCGSLYLAAASLLDVEKRAAAGETVGMFSYGSGCCAEFFTAEVGRRPELWEGRVGLIEGISRRQQVDYATYLAFRSCAEELQRGDSFRSGAMPLAERVPPDVRHFFLGYRGNERVYVAGHPARARATAHAAAGAQPRA